MLITSGSQRVKCVHWFKSSNFIKSLICSIIINLTFEILIIIIIETVLCLFHNSILVFTSPLLHLSCCILLWLENHTSLQMFINRNLDSK